jgi:hypothetical protein
MSEHETRGQKVPVRCGVEQSESYISGGVFYVDLGNWPGGWIASEYSDAVEVRQ